MTTRGTVPLFRDRRRLPASFVGPAWRLRPGDTRHHRGRGACPYFGQKRDNRNEVRRRMRQESSRGARFHAISKIERVDNTNSEAMHIKVSEKRSPQKASEASNMIAGHHQNS